MSDKNKNLITNKESTSIEKSIEVVEEVKPTKITVDIHAEMSPTYNWGHIINKSLGPILVEYDNTAFSIPIKGISDVIRKDLITKISSSLYQWKKV